jgi:hypothetical protein
MSVTWQQIRESLQSFDRTATLQTVQQFLNAELLSVRFDRPHHELLHVRQDEVWLLVRKLQPLLTQTAGVWYGAGELMVGDEILTGWCWCHGFPISLEAPTRPQQVQQGAIAILDQLEQRRDYLLKLCEFFDR